MYLDNSRSGFVYLCILSLWSGILLADLYIHTKHVTAVTVGQEKKSTSEKKSEVWVSPKRVGVFIVALADKTIWSHLSQLQNKNRALTDPAGRYKEQIWKKKSVWEHFVV